jgi:N-acetylglucosamine-6-phosphate deacetylase
MIAITAALLFTPVEEILRPLLLLEDGRVHEISSLESKELPKHARLLDFGDAILSPGLVDIHNHGAAGHDVMEASPDALPVIEQLLAHHGVTSYLPTTVTAPVDATLAALERLADAIEKPHTEGLRARPVGIHTEGPFLSHARRGVHPPKDLLLPTLQVFDRFWQAARGHIRVMTIAPELEGASELIAEAARRGVCVSIGHSDATLQQAREGVRAGASHATHTFNAMRPLSHRDPGLLAEILTNRDLSADIIADGLHLDPAIVKLFLELKGPERAVLITDSTAGTGMPDGHYHMGDFEFDVRDGKCLANGVIAGSVLTLDRAVQNAMAFGGWTLQNALRAATLNPAHAAHLEDAGSLKLGAVADFIVLSSSGEVRQTILGGHVAEPARSTS